MYQDITPQWLTEMGTIDFVLAVSMQLLAEICDLYGARGRGATLASFLDHKLRGSKIRWVIEILSSLTTFIVGS